MASLPDRPAVLTPKAQRKIVDLLVQGNYLSTACSVAGISVQTFNYWRRLFEDGAEHAQIYADFFAAVKAAGAVAEAESLGRVRAGVMGWQGSAWFLERRFPQKWAVAKDRPEKTDKKSRHDVVSEAKKRAQDRRGNRKPD